jgi:hypothetical protein
MVATPIGWALNDAVEPWPRRVRPGAKRQPALTSLLLLLGLLFGHRD